MRLLLIVNDNKFFLSHRLPVALAAQEEGYDVHIATADDDSIVRTKSYGLTHHIVPLSRCGRNPIKEFQSFWYIYRLIRRLRPDLVHLVTIKPVLYGGIAARLCIVPGITLAIPGLGSYFVPNGFLENTQLILIKALYRIALGHKNMRVIFQNPADRSALLDADMLDAGQAVLIKGSGVAIKDYPIYPEPTGTPVVVFASRLLRHKGVCEFVNAARLLHSRGQQVRFRLIGSPDLASPHTITDDELKVWELEGDVEVVGYRTDIAKQFADANIVVLPSYYGEGLPKVLIEAAACGRAVVTTDHQGCRDAILPERTGLLVAERDPVALANAIERLLGDSQLRQRMGCAARELAIREFNIEKVVDAHLDLYRELSAASELYQV